MSDYYFGFLMGIGFTVAFIAFMWALCEDYYQWRKRRETAKAAQDVPWINIPDVVSRKERTRARKSERKPRRK